MPFQDDDYTPFGYLRNPGHRARSWKDCEGGNLHACDELVGLEWVYPWHNDPKVRASLSLTTRLGPRLVGTRGDFAELGLSSRYHSANIFGFDWSGDGLEVSARYFLVGDDALCARVEARNVTGQPRELAIGFVGTLDGTAGASAEGGALLLPQQDPVAPRAHALAVRDAADPTRERAGAVARDIVEWSAHVPASGRVVGLAALGRGATAEEALQRARRGLADAEATFARLLAEDDAFHARCPALDGDWPEHWRQGLVYDFETTRLCVLPAGGIFRDVWPTWMAAWPRVVFAEGPLDMLRLSYADPKTAKRALLTLLRDAPAPNVPCVFQGGEPNMVARDGSVCGTSPAWCLPFLGFELLYLRTLDIDWLGQAFPFLEAYLTWWLRHRVDPEGWIVYKCTWESGEDGNPRLDPSASGDADISGHVRPVELQATVAYSAGVLAFFADELGLRDAAAAWRRVRGRYRRRTRQLYDPAERRFRDWLIQERRFQEPRPDDLYWGVDARRWSPLSLTPLLGVIAAPEQARALTDEVRRHATPPWTWWPSWTHALAECAAAAGLHDLAGEVAHDVLARVYPENDRRSLEPYHRPTPGVAREYWPASFDDWKASDAYGWGATTANLLLRHLLGLQESRDTSRWILDVAPAFPEPLRKPGRRYAVRRFTYRGLTLDLAYRFEQDGLALDLELPEPRRCMVLSTPGRRAIHRSPAAARVHTIRPLAIGERYRLVLDSRGV